MPVVEVTYEELRAIYRSFSQHSPNAIACKCSCLDALYAVECGISAVILKENKAKNTEFITNKTHDIRILLKKCKSPPSINFPHKISLSPHRNLKDHVMFPDFHSALRYGAKISDEEWKKCGVLLDRLREWITIQISER